MNTEFGRLATTADSLTYALIVEQRKTNELLQSLLDLNKKPEPEPEVVTEPEPEPEPKPEPKPAKTVLKPVK